MRAVLQRVSRAEVRVDGQCISRIGNGLLILLGIAQGDDQSAADYLAEKIAGLRIFEDPAGKMNLSVRTSRNLFQKKNLSKIPNDTPIGSQA